MVIYEVNLIIDRGILHSFQAWLDAHIQEMLTIDGFISAEKFKDLEDEKRISVRYQVENMRKLNQYFSNHAEKMRDEGKNRFNDKFTAERRIFKLAR